MAQADKAKGSAPATQGHPASATPAPTPAPTPVEAGEQDMLKAENLQKQIAELAQEAVRISALDPVGSARLFRQLQNLSKTQGVALRDKTLAKMDVHKKEVEEVLSGAYSQINDYVKEHNLPAMNLTIGVGYTGTVDAELLNGPKFSWASASTKPIRIRSGHKRSGTLSKDGKEIGKFDSATAAAKEKNVSLTAKNRETGKEYDVPATKALKDAGYDWQADAA